jgi:hypothetical protein
MSDATYNLNGSFKPPTKRSADLNGPDFFPTPRWATFALTENETFNGEIWECACGDGSMSRVLAETGQPIRSTDLYDRGYGTSGVDFLAYAWFVWDSQTLAGQTELKWLKPGYKAQFAAAA